MAEEENMSDDDDVDVKYCELCGDGYEAHLLWRCSVCDILLCPDCRELHRCDI